MPLWPAIAGSISAAWVYCSFVFGSAVTARLAIFVGFGNGLTIANSNAGSTSVRPGLAGTAAGLSGASAVGLGVLLS
jgi:hypothetical protein